MAFLLMEMPAATAARALSYSVVCSIGSCSQVSRLFGGIAHLC